jgi:hypothetical protein
MIFFLEVRTKSALPVMRVAYYLCEPISCLTDDLKIMGYSWIADMIEMGLLHVEIVSADAIV